MRVRRQVLDAQQHREEAAERERDRRRDEEQHADALVIGRREPRQDRRLSVR